MGVLRRHRLIVVSGFAVALALAFLSYVRVSEAGLAYRKPEVWSSEATLILSGAYHPEWRSVLPATAQPDRFTSLVDLYSELATSDDVMASLRKQSLIKPEAGGLAALPISATAVHSTFNGTPTPLLKITALAITPADARRLVIRATDAFIRVLRSRQAAAKIPESQRVELRIVKRSDVPKLAQPRSKTTFMLIFLAGLIATAALAFVRDNFQRGANRRTQQEPPTGVERLQPAAEPPVSSGSESVLAAPSEASHSETNGADHNSDVRSVTRSRWSAGSSG